MNNFYTNTKILTCYFLLLLWSISLVGSFGCSSIPKETQIVITYQSMGTILEEAKPAILALCDNDVFSYNECSQAITAYNQAVTIYLTLGDLAAIGIDTGVDSGFHSMALELQALLLIVNNFLVAQ